MFLFSFLLDENSDIHTHGHGACSAATVACVYGRVLCLYSIPLALSARKKERHYERNFQHTHPSPSEMVSKSSSRSHSKSPIRSSQVHVLQPTVWCSTRAWTLSSVKNAFVHECPLSTTESFLSADEPQSVYSSELSLRKCT